jgi:hypothetical protein
MFTLCIAEVLNVTLGIYSIVAFIKMYGAEFYFCDTEVNCIIITRAFSVSDCLAFKVLY